MRSTCCTITVGRGNVRELENVVRRALVLAPGEFVEPEDFELQPVSTPKAVDEIVPPPAASELGAEEPAPTYVIPRAESPESRWQRLEALASRAAGPSGRWPAPARLHRLARGQPPNCESRSCGLGCGGSAEERGQSALGSLLPRRGDLRGEAPAESVWCSVSMRAFPDRGWARSGSRGRFLTSM